jgi:hypothetical protein
MTTAVVVATVVKTNLSEANFLNHALDQIRHNDRNLLAKIADKDQNANIVTAVLNVDEFMTYLLERMSAVNVAPAHVAPAEVVEEKPKTTVVTEMMSEFEFMNQIADELQTEARTGVARLTMEDLQAIEDELIGDELSRKPFLY